MDELIRIKTTLEAAAPISQELEKRLEVQPSQRTSEADIEKS